MSNQENYKWKEKPYKKGKFVSKIVEGKISPQQTYKSVYFDPVLTEESVKMYQSSYEVVNASKSLAYSMEELASGLRDGEVGYREHLNTTEGFDKVLQEVEGNVAKLIKIINGEEL